VNNDILVDLDGRVATVSLNRPEKLNAVTPEHFRRLTAIMGELSADTQVRVAIITGVGRAFCAGGDVSILSRGGPAAGKPFDEAVDIIRNGSQNTVEAIRNARPIVIAAVNGVCAGGGLSLACAADLRYASDRATFTTAFARVAQPGDMGLGWNLSALIGTARARELMFLSPVIDAASAAQLGLVNATVAHNDLLDHVNVVAEQIATFAPLAIAAM